MKTAFLSLLSLCSVSLTFAVPSLTLNCHSYPDVCDHHVYADGCAAADFRFTASQNGFHRDGHGDDSINAKRRRAVGCGGVTNCGDNMDCDEIPYASTYDGGLGCYGVSAGYQGPQTNLYSRGSHHCVNRSQNRRHGNAVMQFYANTQLDLTTEASPSSYSSGTFAYRQVVVKQNYQAAKTDAERAKFRAEYEANCRAYAQTGQQAVLSRASRTGVCPDRNAARYATNINTTAAGTQEDRITDSARAVGNNAAIAASAAMNFGLDQPRQVLTLSSGTKVYALYGAPVFKLGHNVTLHGDKPVDAEGNFHTWNETVVGIHFD
ncbi:hypothetical protein OC835_000359 [Tilletia horrida]|nr:hypothetical protein OC835_000359 [Tilletia horrida]